MIYVIGSVGVLLTILLAGMIVMVAARGIDVDDIDVGDDEDDDEDDEPIGYVRRVPPFPILHLGRSGEHDRYPVGANYRRTCIDYLEASWNLPDRKPGATR